MWLCAEQSALGKKKGEEGEQNYLTTSPKQKPTIIAHPN